MKGPVETMQSPARHNKSSEFSDFMWMADQPMEEFDKQVEEEMLEQELIDSCFEQMLAEEEEAGGNWYYPPQGNTNTNSSAFTNQLQGLNIQENEVNNKLTNVNCITVTKILKKSDDKETDNTACYVNKQAIHSELNPNAAEFVPRGFT